MPTDSFGSSGAGTTWTADFIALMAFLHVATGTGTDQDLLDLARAKLARVLAGATEYTDAAGNRVKITESEDELLDTVVRLTALVNGASGMARNLADLRRRP